MKVNGTPEEIYLLPDDRNSNGLSICWYEAPYKTGAIEYIRKDAFVEEACEWLRNNSHNYANNALGKEYLVNDFKNYIEKDKL